MEAAEFLRRAGPLLMENEARHNLILGIALAIAANPHEYPDADTWLVESLGSTVAAALRTPPHNLVLADASSPGAIDSVIDLVSAVTPTLPGVIGNRPSVDWFIDRWTSRFGLTPNLIMDQGVFALEAVKPVTRIKGEMKRAGAAERSLVLAWLQSFDAEVFSLSPTDGDALEAAADRRLTADLASGMWLWTVEGQSVAMAGYGGQTPNGVRVGPVYTPPDLRGNGYASALVASMSEWLLKERGRRFCFLYTDLANPVSNDLYRRIGYQQVAEAAQYHFG